MSTFTMQPFWGVNQRTNYCANPSFYTDASYWNSSIAATLARTTNPATGWGSALEVTGTATGAVQVRYGTDSTDSIVVSAGQRFTIQALMRVPSGTRTGQALVNFYDASNTVVGTVYGTATPINATGPTLVGILDGTVPATATMMRCYWKITDAAAVGEKFWMSRVCIERKAGAFGSFPAYFDLNTQPTNYTTERIQTFYYGSGGSTPCWAWYAARADEQITPLFGPKAPLSYKISSAVLVHEMLDDPGTTWQTMRKSRKRTGEFVLLFNTWAEAYNAAYYFAAPHLFNDPGNTTKYATAWSYDGDGMLNGVIPKWVVPDGAEVDIAHVEELLPNSTNTEWLWQLTVPYKEVS